MFERCRPGKRTTIVTAARRRLEQSLQAIDPAIALPYWDYSLDFWEQVDSRDGVATFSNESDLLRLWDSEIWSAKYFGRADADTGVIVDGAWARTKVPVISERLLNDSGFSGHFRDHGFASCYGQDEDVCEAPWTAGFREGIVLNPSGATEPKTGTSERHVGNSFGLLRSPWNMRAEPAVVRSRKSCGRKNDLQFPDCTSFINQQHDFDTFEDYVVNLQVSPHGAVHVWAGGAFGRCSETYAALHDVVPDAALVDAFKISAANIQKSLWMEGLRACPARGACAGLGQDDCACHVLEVDAMARNASRNVSASWTWNQVLQIVFSTVHVNHEVNARAYLNALPDAAKLKILKAISVDVLTGDMIGSNSPYDIAFFATHASVERLWQRKALAGNMSDMAWPQQDGRSGAPLCPGQKAGYKLVWFDYALDDDDAVSSDLTNVEWRDMLNPANPAYATHIPYVYENFVWEHCMNYIALNPDQSGVIDATLMRPDQWVWQNTEDWTAR